MQDQRVRLDRTAALDRLMLQDLEGTVDHQMPLDLQIRLALKGIADLHQHLDHQVLDHQVPLVLAVAHLVEAQGQEVEDLAVVVAVAFNSRQ